MLVPGIMLRMKGDTKQAQKELQLVTEKIKETKEWQKKLRMGFYALAAGTAYAMKAAIDYGDYLEKTSQKIGVGTEALSAYKLGAELAGTSQEKLVSGLQRLQKGMGEALSTPTSRTAMAFKTLGLEITDTDGNLRDVEELLVDFSEVMSKLPDGTAKTAIAMDLMGRSGADLIPFLNQGAEGLDNMRVESERLGILWDEDASDSAAKFNDEITTLGYTMTGWVQTATRYWLPSLEKMAGFLNDAARDFSGATQAAIDQDFAKGQMRQTIKDQEEVLKSAQANYKINLDSWREMNADKEYVETEYHKTLREIMEKEQKLYNNLFNELGQEAGLVTSEMESEIAKMEKLKADILKLSDYNPEADKKAEAKRQKAAERKLAAARKLAEREAEIARKAVEDQLKAELKVVDNFRDSLKTEEQLLNEQYELRKAMIQKHVKDELDAAYLLAEAKGDLVAGLLAIELDADQARVDANRDRVARETEQALAQREQQKINEQTYVDGQFALASASVTAWGAISQIVTDNLDMQTEEGRNAAKAMFAITQGLALASAVVTTAQSISQALSNPPGVPYTIPAGVAAGVIGAAQIATIVGTTIAGIADAGLTPDTLRKAGLNQHTAIAIGPGEMVLDPVGTSHITEMLARENRGGRGGGGPRQITTTVVLDGRVVGKSTENYLVDRLERGHDYRDRSRTGRYGGDRVT